MRDFPDLIRNYKLILKGKTPPDSLSNSESQPLMSSQSSSSDYRGTNNNNNNRHDEMFQADSDTEIESSGPYNNHNRTITTSTPSALLKNHNSLTEVILTDRFLDSDKSFLSSLEYGILEAVPINTTHNSLVTIFAIWNTTVGTSLLSMAWGIQKTGLFPSILINVLIAATCLYTAHAILKVNQTHGVAGQCGEVCDLSRALLGRWAEITAKIFSPIVLIGANIVYWILMSNFLYNAVNFVYFDILLKVGSVREDNGGEVLCLKNETNFSGVVSLVEGHGEFQHFWDLYTTVPVILGVIMFPLLNWKSPTFFTKFNSLGTFSVLYLIVFVAAKAFKWGIHLDLDDLSGEFKLKSTFCALTGMLSLSYFIHNIIISIMRNNKHQENNGRDLSIAFGLILFTYLFMGVVFYVTFPLPKFCIEDNILNNFNKSDVLTLIARILLLFQLFTVFPLMSYMLRNEVLANLSMICNVSFTYTRVILINITILGVCILFACFLPRIGTLIRYTGALSGLVYIFVLPSLLKVASLRKERKLTTTKLLFFVVVMIVGVLNLISQFFIKDE